MLTKKVYLTQEGFGKLKAELQKLHDVKRPKLVKQLQETQQGSDWMDNSEFIPIQDELAFINARIHELEDILATGELIEPQNKDDVVDIGDTAVLQSNDHLETYTIVGTAEADPSQGLISNESPLGKALLHHKVGDSVLVEAPAGRLHYQIVAVR